MIDGGRDAGSGPVVARRSGGDEQASAAQRAVSVRWRPFGFMEG